MFNYRIDKDTEMRLLTERDAEQFFAVITEHIERNPDLDENLSIEDVRKKIRGDLELLAANKGQGSGIWFRGEFAGAVRYHEIDWRNRSTELGYWLGARFEGKGLMTKACRVLIGHAFGTLRLNRIVISCAIGNPRSSAVAKRLGFTREAVLRGSEFVQDKFSDMEIYALLASDWKANAEYRDR